MAKPKRPKKPEPRTNPPPLTPKREHSGTPIRPEKFPSIRQAATLAALLSGSPPKTDGEAREAARAALRLWQATRDEINEQQERSAKYWQSSDESKQAIQAARSRIKTRLELLGKQSLADQEIVTWQEAADALFVSSPPKQRDAELSKIVTENMVGKSCWRMWKLEDFKDHGFDTSLGFASLVQFVDSIETEKEAKAKSEKFSKLGKKSAAKRNWGKCA